MKTIVRAVVAGGLAIILAACSSDRPATPPPAGTSSSAAAPPSVGAAVPALAATTVRPLADTGGAPFDQIRRLQAPPGWKVTVWARVPGARLLALTPNHRLLVSRPSRCRRTRA